MHRTISYNDRNTFYIVGFTDAEAAEGELFRLDLLWEMNTKPFVALTFGTTC